MRRLELISDNCIITTRIIQEDKTGKYQASVIRALSVSHQIGFGAGLVRVSEYNQESRGWVFIEQKELPNI